MTTTNPSPHTVAVPIVELNQLNPGLRDRSFLIYFSSFASFGALRETAFCTQRRKARKEESKREIITLSIA